MTRRGFAAKKEEAPLRRADRVAPGSSVGRWYSRVRVTRTAPNSIADVATPSSVGNPPQLRFLHCRSLLKKRLAMTPSTCCLSIFFTEIASSQVRLCCSQRRRSDSAACDTVSSRLARSDRQENKLCAGTPHTSFVWTRRESSIW